jgi:NADH:ubiquinone oxidoreductase subunit 4 (subunit M)
LAPTVFSASPFHFFQTLPLAATPYFVALAVIGIIYGAVVAMMQSDIKKLVAYSSVSHLGFVILGLFALNMQGVQGAIYQMINHGLSTGALFLLVGMIYERRHTRMIDAFGGLWQTLPVFSTLFLVVMFSSIGLPGLNGFVGEFLILLGSFSVAPRWTAVATTGVILGAVYMLWMFRRVIFGPLTHAENQQLKDLNGRELLILAPIVLLIVFMGIYPQPFLRRIEPAVEQTLKKSVRHDGAAGGLSIIISAGSKSAMDVNLTPLLPAIQVLVTALVVVGRDLFIEENESKGVLVFYSLVGLGLAAAEVVVLLSGRQESAFNESIVLDGFALFFHLDFFMAAALTILSSIHYVRQTAIHEGEFYSLILFATVGMILMAAANDLIVFFLGLETMSIAIYVLTGMWRSSGRSSEASMKYFLMGAFATGFLLYGIALIYGATGSTNLNQISTSYSISRPSGRFI